MDTTPQSHTISIQSRRWPRFHPIGRIFALGFFAIFTSGCWGWTRLSGGYATSTSFDTSRMGASFDYDVVLGEDRSRVGMAAALRGKASQSTGDFSMFLGMLVLQPPAPVGVYLLGGANFIQLGSTDSDFAFGMGSPSAELGMIIETSFSEKPQHWITLGARLEYDLRFTHQPHEGFFLTTLGYAFANLN